MKPVKNVEDPCSTKQQPVFQNAAKYIRSRFSSPSMFLHLWQLSVFCFHRYLTDFLLPHSEDPPSPSFSIYMELGTGDVYQTSGLHDVCWHRIVNCAGTSSHVIWGSMENHLQAHRLPIKASRSWWDLPALQNIFSLWEIIILRRSLISTAQWYNTLLQVMDTFTVNHR